MRLLSAVQARVRQAGVHFEKTLEEHESKIVAGGMCAVVGGFVLNAATGNVSALGGNETATLKYYGMSTITWIFAVFAILFGVGTMWLRDFRIAMLAGLALIGTVVVSVLGI